MRRRGDHTIRDVAKEARVSLGTVSRVLNGHESVSPEIRARVERAIRTLGYAPNAVAQSMRNKQTRTVGCIIRDINLPALAAFVRAAHDVLFQAGYALLLTNSEGRREREFELVSLLASRKADALILAHHSEEDVELHRMLEATGMPVVLFDRERPEWADAVMVDHRGGVRRATEQLLQLGHRRIALITGHPALYPARARIAGFEAAHKAYGVRLAPDLVRTESFLADYAFQQTSILVASKSPPTAIIAGGIDVLPGVLRALRMRGLEIPRDLSLVAASDSDLAQLSVPPITVESWDYAEVGRIAAQLVLERIGSTAGTEPRRVLVPAELIQRGSCGPVPATRRRRR
ncbi:MAG: substrate-binding domain-containing protein [Burkholderiales bacterium]|mgnify:CR=1 FL=1